MTEPTIPTELTRQGMRRMTDNLAGRVVVLPAGTLVMFFGEELRRALEARDLARSGTEEERTK